MSDNSSHTILIIDDEAPFREDLAEILREEGFECKTAEDGEVGLEHVRESPPDVILCDIVMPGIDGLEVLKRVHEVAPETGVFMVTAYGNLDTAVDTFREGAYDYLTKPVNPDEAVEKIHRYLEYQDLANEVDRLRREISRTEDSMEDQLIGDSSTMQEVSDLIEQAGETDSNVLITGETGTGKELVARNIHKQTEREPFMAVNCAALTESLLESELFGHRKGAFTGATDDKKGYFEVADGGTLFLDEISEMEPDLQVKLLRAIEEKAVQRVGDTETIDVDVRILASSNRDLAQTIEQGGFREDLYYRLNVLRVEIPPLRQRREDIPLLVDYFINRYNREMNRKVLGVENQAIQALMTYDWPGNVRELENIVERWMIIDSDEMLKLETLANEIKSGGESRTELTGDLKQAVDAYEKEHIRNVLETTGGDRAVTAEKLGIDPSTLYRKMEKHNLA